jgi:hypothetical protein
MGDLVNGLGTMRRIAFLVALCGMPMLAAADTVRLASMPGSFWGTWAPDAGACNDPSMRISLSGSGYVGPNANCRVVSVSETSSQDGPIYSARLECLTPTMQKESSNLIIRPKGKEGLLTGNDLQSLKPYQRCSTNAAAPALPAAPAQQPDQTIEARVAEWLKTCLADWDRETHMTKSEWIATCRRVAAERAKFLAEDQSKGLPAGPVDKPPRPGTRLYR